MSAPIPPNEERRLRALRASKLLDSPSEASFDELAKLASQICGTPIALVSLVDEHRQWFKAKVGLKLTETPRKHAFCAHALHSTAILEIPDAADDDRFRANPLVTGAPHIRFYAGYPLATPEGDAFGTLCVIDRKPRLLAAEQRFALEVLGRQAVALISLQRHAAAAAGLIHEKRFMEAELLASENRYRGVIERMGEGVYFIDHSTGRILHPNAALAAMLGYSERELCGITARDLFTGEDEATIASTRALAEEALSRDGRCDLGRRLYRRKDGSVLDVAVQIGRVDHGPVGMTCVIVRDITDQARYEERLEESQRELEKANQALKKSSTTDALTGARNRAAFDEKLGREFARAARNRRPLSLLLLDVDHFKTFNDTFGHPAGDEVLREVSRLLRGIVRTVDVVARYGGEEFGVILPDTDIEGATLLAQRCRKAVAEAQWPKRAITVSIGASTLGPRTDTPLALVEEADVALYRSKKQGRNQVHHAMGNSGIRPGL